MKAKIKHILDAHKTIDGAGVRLKRIFSNSTVELTDPFLLLDNFGSSNPDDYLAGFPWHPHRGIETVTYMLSGEVNHGDSLGNKGTIYAGDMQWMTAGSGIIHEEMPQLAEEALDGLQLWVNLPAKQKMIPPKYRGITQNMISTIKKDGAEIKIIAGTYDGITGPVKDLVVEVSYLDVKLTKKFSFNLKESMNTFLYLFEGRAVISGKEIGANSAVFLTPGDLIVEPKNMCRFILVSGRPLNEPVAWGGPIVMNTQEELENAFKELGEGTFIKSVEKKPVSDINIFYKE